VTGGTGAQNNSINSSLVSSITRSDGTTQITYNGHPLYYYSKDVNSGDINGQGFNNKWYAVSPAGDPIMTSMTPGAPSMSGTPEAPSGGTPMAPSSGTPASP
jgi:hypothetical protein